MFIHDQWCLNILEMAWTCQTHQAGTQQDLRILVGSLTISKHPEIITALVPCSPQLPQGLCAIPLRRYVHVLRERPFAFRHWERGGPQRTPPWDLILCLSKHFAQWLVASAKDTLMFFDVVRRWMERKVLFNWNRVVWLRFGFFLSWDVRGYVGSINLWFYVIPDLEWRVKLPPFIQMLSHFFLSCAHVGSQLVAFVEMLAGVWKSNSVKVLQTVWLAHWKHLRYWKCPSLRLFPFLSRVSQPSSSFEDTPSICFAKHVPSEEHHRSLILHLYSCTRDMISFGFGCVGGFIPWNDWS